MVRASYQKKKKVSVCEKLCEEIVKKVRYEEKVYLDGKEEIERILQGLNVDYEVLVGLWLLQLESNSLGRKHCIEIWSEREQEVEIEDDRFRFECKVLIPENNVVKSSGERFQQSIPVIFRSLGEFYGRKECEFIRGAVLLYSLWIKQRDLDHKRSFRTWEFALLLQFLSEKLIVKETMSSYHVIKVAFSWLINTPLGTNLSFEKEELSHSIKKKVPKTIALYKQITEKNRLNLFQNVGKAYFSEILHEMNLTLQFFKLQTERALKSIFLIPHDARKRYDIIIRMKLNVEVDFLLDISYEGFNSMCHVIRILENHEGYVTLGLVLAKGWEDGVILGPKQQSLNPSKKELNKITLFKEMWGNLVSLEDGIQYKVEFLERQNNPIEELLELWNLFAERNFKSTVEIVGKTIATHIFKPKTTIYRNILDQLQNKLSEIDIHLTIEELIGNSPEFRDCAVFPIQPDSRLEKWKISGLEDEFHNLLHSDDDLTPTITKLQPLNCVLKFTSESRFPQDPLAIKKMKQFILLEYSRKLNLKTHLTEDWLDIEFHQFVFRLVICIEKEISTYKTSGHILNQNVIAMDRELIGTPLHAKAILQLSEHFPSFSQTVRLVKLWMCSHYLMGPNQISDVLVELLVSYAFLEGSYPYSSPKTPINGFYRTISLIANLGESKIHFVQMFLSTDDMLPFYTLEETRVLERLYEEYEFIPNKPALFIVASYNMELGNYWTKYSIPEKFFVDRMIQEANRSLVELQHFMDEQSKGKSVNWLHLFENNLDDADFVISLGNLVYESSTDKIGFNPRRQFVKSLYRMYPNCHFLFNPVSDSKVGIICHEGANKNVIKQELTSLTNE